MASSTSGISNQTSRATISQSSQQFAPSFTTLAWDNFVKRAGQEIIFTIQDGDQTYSLENGVYLLDTHQNGPGKTAINIQAADYSSIRSIFQQAIELAAAYLIAKKCAELTKQLTYEPNQQEVVRIRNVIGMYQQILQAVGFPSKILAIYANPDAIRNPGSRLARALSFTFPNYLMQERNLEYDSFGIKLNRIYLMLRPQTPPAEVCEQPVDVVSEKPIPSEISSEEITQMLQNCEIDMSGYYWGAELNYLQVFDAETDEPIGYYRQFMAHSFMGLDMHEYAFGQLIDDQFKVNLGTKENPDFLGSFDPETYEWYDEDGNLFAYVDTSTQYYYDRENNQMFGFPEGFLDENFPSLEAVEQHCLGLHPADDESSPSNGDDEIELEEEIIPDEEPDEISPKEIIPEENLDDEAPAE